MFSRLRFEPGIGQPGQNPFTYINLTLKEGNPR
jgi:hypothetical protein